jgi:hypothetical protein
MKPITLVCDMTEGGLEEARRKPFKEMHKT